VVRAQPFPQQGTVSPALSFPICGQNASRRLPSPNLTVVESFNILRPKLLRLTQLGLQLSIRRNLLTIAFPSGALFVSDTDELTEGGKIVLTAVSNVLRSEPGLINRDYQVEGHLESQEQSLRRAQRVGAFLTSPQGGLPPGQLCAVGRGATDPIASSSTQDGQERNRRVELVMVSSP